MDKVRNEDRWYETMIKGDDNDDDLDDGDDGRNDGDDDDDDDGDDDEMVRTTIIMIMTSNLTHTNVPFSTIHHCMRPTPDFPKMGTYLAQQLSILQGILTSFHGWPSVAPGSPKPWSWKWQGWLSLRQFLWDWRLTSSLTCDFAMHHVFHTKVPTICQINQLDAWMNRIKIWWRGLSVVEICSPSKESLTIPDHCSPTIGPGHVWCHQMQGDFHQTLSSNGPSSCKQNNM